MTLNNSLDDDATVRVLRFGEKFCQGRLVAPPSALLPCRLPPILLGQSANSIIPKHSGGILKACAPLDLQLSIP
jgi:hypothetical protein